MKMKPGINLSKRHLKKGRRFISWRTVLLTFFSILLMIEIVSAPLEWLWPVSWGGNTCWRGNTDAMEIALTFDDGPSRYTAAVLDILKENEAPATFFIMGKQAERFPEVVKRIAAEGHEIGNHTYSFAAQKNKFFSQIDRSEITKTQEIIQKLVDMTPIYFRSPGGQFGRYLWQDIRKHNLRVINGALPIPHPGKDAETQLAVIKSTLKPGAIIILHDGDDGAPDSNRPASTVALLPELFDELSHRGFSVVPLKQLLKDQLLQ